ncbi:sulfotransferase family 2 domain-containing protein [Yoonia sp. MH D7]
MSQIYINGASHLGQMKWVFMIISPGRNYIFVHIPKTGGTAMAAALETRAMRDDILIGDTPKAQKRKARLNGIEARGRVWKHSTVADMAGVIDPAGMFVFTLVRNPWDRMVSYYIWLQAQSFAHPAVARARSHDFSGFLNAPQTRYSVAKNDYGSYVTEDAHFFRLEHLESDLQSLWQHLGFQLTISPRNQSVRRRDWRGYYSDADAALVADLCAVDIARSEYAFDPDRASLDRRLL